jgi:hypothetical protein
MITVKRRDLEDERSIGNNTRLPGKPCDALPITTEGALEAMVSLPQCPEPNHAPAVAHITTPPTIEMTMTTTPANAIATVMKVTKHIVPPNAVTTTTTVTTETVTQKKKVNQ